MQLHGTELMLEFIGDAGRRRPRRGWPSCGRAGASWRDLFEQCVAAMRLLAGAGYAHGDLSPYNLLVHGGRLVMIDLPQVVDLAANPQGAGLPAPRLRATSAPGSRGAGWTTVEFDHLVRRPDGRGRRRLVTAAA